MIDLRFTTRDIRINAVRSDRASSRDCGSAGTHRAIRWLSGSNHLDVFREIAALAANMLAYCREDPGAIDMLAELGR